MLASSGITLAVIRYLQRRTTPAVGIINGYTGSYSGGFIALGGLAVLGSIAMVLYGRFAAPSSEEKYV